jgi:predicted RND superfamily exporter protein
VRNSRQTAQALANLTLLVRTEDIFIFMDAYKQSKFRDPDNLESLETRMSWVYRRTGTAMAITSATTCAAFLCTLITPLVEIKSFGIFAACVILIDYVLVMTLFCTAVVIYHDRYEDRPAKCGCCTDCTYTEPSPTESAQEALKASDSNEEQGDRVSVFFRTKVATFVQVPWHRIVMFLMFAGWISVAVWQTSKLEPTKETEQFLDEDHPLQKTITILNSEFPTADSDLGLKVYYTWGLGLVSREGVSLLFDPFLGDPVYLESFDFNEQCQTELANACAKFKTDDRYEPYIKRDGGVGSVFCFVEELAAYSVKGDLMDCDYVRQGDWKNEKWQISPDNLASVMEGFVQQMSCGDQAQTIQSYYSNELGWDGKSLRYASIAVESENLDPFSTPSEGFTKSQYDQFVSMAEEVDDAVSEYCTGQVIMTDLDQRFIFMNNQNIYLRTAIQSSILGVAIAFTVLLLATRVFHIAFFASLSIVSVLVSVTGTMVMLGWNLGSIESVLISIIAGFSVDYVVHLAHAYEASDGDAYERVTAAFGDMGISVLNGMITSVAASIPLFFCQLQFFAKFGTFLCLTIAFSWIFANFIFMSILAQLKIPIKEGRGFRW